MQGGGDDQKLIVKSVVHMVPGSAHEQTRADGLVAYNAQGVNWFHGLDSRLSSLDKPKTDINRWRAQCPLWLISGHLWGIA